MQPLNLFQIFTSRLNRSGLRYMVTGAVASIVYGEPRLTHDIDLVVELNAADAEKITGIFTSDEFYCAPAEIIRIEAKRPLKGHFNIIHLETGFKADIYTAGQDSLHHWALQRRRLLEVGGEPLYLAPIEYVIVRKLLYYREGGSEKHLRDIGAMVSLSSDQIDFEQLNEKVRKYGLGEEWEKAKEFVR